MGLADMAAGNLEIAARSRSSGEMGLHLVEVMEAFFKSSKSGRKITMKSTCRQPKALPAGLPLGKLS